MTGESRAGPGRDASPPDLDAILQSHPREVGQLLALLSVLGRADVPVWLLAEGAEELPEPLAGAAGAGTGSLLELSRPLEEDGVLASGRDGWELPERVREAVAERLAPSERARYGAAAVRLLHRAFPDRVGGDPERCRSLAPHVVACAEHPRGGGRATSEAVHVLARLAAFHRHQQEPGRAVEVYRTALEVGGRGAGVEAGLRAVVHDELASALVAVGEEEEAHRIAARGRDLAERAFPEESPRFPMILSNLGTTFREVGDLDRAAGCLRRAVTAVEGADGDGSERIRALEAELRLAIADVLMRQERFPAAARSAGRALETVRDALRPVHPLASRAAWILADALRAQGEAERSTELYRRALDVEQELHDGPHPAVGQKAMALGLHLEELGQGSEAAQQYRRALRIFRETLGEEAGAVRSVRRCLERVEDGEPT